MKQLNRLQSIVFLVGGILMAIGVGCYVFMFQKPVACWVFLVGALMFAFMQIVQLDYNQQPTENKEQKTQDNLTIRRLRRIMLIADVLFVLAGFLMVETEYQFLRPLFPNLETYIHYVFNKWIVPLLVAAILEIYTTHRLSNELNKEKKR